MQDSSGNVAEEQLGASGAIQCVVASGEQDCGARPGSAVQVGYAVPCDAGTPLVFCSLHCGMLRFFYTAGLVIVLSRFCLCDHHVLENAYGRDNSTPFLSLSLSVNSPPRPLHTSISKVFATAIDGVRLHCDADEK